MKKILLCSFTLLLSQWQVVAAQQQTEKISPVVIALSPANHARNVSATAPLQLVFSEPIKKKTGIIKITTGSVVDSIDAAGPSVIVSGNELVILPGKPWGSCSNIRVEIPAGVIVDNAGNPFTGIQDEWNFRTAGTDCAADTLFADKQPPKVVALQPPSSGGQVAVTAKLEIVFDEDVYKGFGNIVVFTDTLGGILASLPVTSEYISIQKNVVIISVPGNFPACASISVQIAGSAFVDNAGNPFAGLGAGSWTFKTAGSCTTGGRQQGLLSAATEVKAFPNPTRGLLKLQIKEYDAKDMRVRCFSNDGREIKMTPTQARIDTDGMEVDLEHLPRGIYLILISDGECRKIAKVVKL